MTMKDLENRLKDVSAGKILDVGTGTGEFVGFISDTFKDYTEIVGIDTSEKALDKAREHFPDPRITFANMNAAKIGFADESFDAVSISNSLHHLPDIECVLDEMSRVLKPGGMFIINEMYSDNLSEKQLGHVKVHHFHARIDTLTGGCHNPTFKRHEIIKVAEGAGLVDLELFDYNTDEEQRETEDLVQEKELTDNMLAGLEARVEQLKDHTEYGELRALLENCRQELYRDGISGATQLLAIGRKQV